MIFLSIVIPIRNEENFIKRTLEMLINQNYPKERYEIIIVDGMSTKMTRTIINDFKNAHPDINLKIFENPNLLSSFARNIGIKHSKGELIAVIDGHVYIPTKNLFHHMERIKKTHQVLCLARPAPLDVPEIKSGTAYWISVARKSLIGHSRGSFIYSNFEGFVNPVSSGFAYDRSVFDNVGYFDENFDAAEDVEFHFRLHQAGIEAYTSQELLIYSYPRKNVAQLFHQQKRYGIGRARFIRKHPKGFSLETLFPPALFLYFLIFPTFIFLFSTTKLLAILYFLSIALYAGLLLLVGMFEAVSRNNFFPGFLVASAIWATHMGLGWGFLKTVFLPAKKLFKLYSPVN